MSREILRGKGGLTGKRGKILKEAKFFHGFTRLSKIMGPKISLF